MGIFDWNNDGKTDWKDDALFHEVISKDESSDRDDDSGLSTAGGFSSRHYSTSSRKSTASHQQSITTINIGWLTKLVIGIAGCLCLFALFSGDVHIIDDILGLGFLAGLFTNWLEKNP